MNKLILDDFSDIETPEKGCIIQAGFVFSSGRELVSTSHKSAAAARLIELLLDLESEKIEIMLKQLL